MFIEIDAHGYAVLFDIPLEAVHGRDGSFIFIKPAVYLVGGIIDIAHKNTLGTSCLKPVMVRTVDLDHLSVVFLPLSSLTVYLVFSVTRPLSFLNEPGSC